MQWLMLQQEQADDFVIATGVQHSVRTFIDKAAAQLGLQLRWEGAGVNEQGCVSAIAGDAAQALKVGDVIVKIDPRYFRPAEVETLLGDPSKAKEKLGWFPKITLDQMVAEMVAHDLDQARQHALLRSRGYKVSVGHE